APATDAGSARAVRLDCPAVGNRPAAEDGERSPARAPKGAVAATPSATTDRSWPQHTPSDAAADPRRSYASDGCRRVTRCGDSHARRSKRKPRVAEGDVGNRVPQRVEHATQRVRLHLNGALIGESPEAANHGAARDRHHLSLADGEVPKLEVGVA